MPRPLPVLYTHFGEDWIRGSEHVLLDLLTHLDRNRVEPVVWCNATAMAEACRALDVTTHQSSFEFYFDYNCPRFAPFRYASMIREGVDLVRRYGIAVLHSNSAAPSQWLVPVSMLTGRPLLAHLHIGYLRRSRYALLLHMADLVVGVSAQVTRGLCEDGMPPERLRVIYNGIDLARFRPATFDLRARLGIAATTPVIATMGSLIHRKGHDLLIRAVAGLKDEASAPHLILGGEGEAHEDLEALALSLGIGDRTHFTGYMKEVVPIYEAADIFALASRSDAFGLVLAEAGHFGLPVVSTQVGGIPEVVLDGRTGLLIPPENVAALQSALLHLIAHPEERRRLGEAGREHVDKTFVVDRMVGEFHKCYEQLASRPRQQRDVTPYRRLLPFVRPKPETRRDGTAER